MKKSNKRISKENDILKNELTSYEDDIKSLNNNVYILEGKLAFSKRENTKKVEKLKTGR